jgi:hypothetical protein
LGLGNTQVIVAKASFYFEREQVGFSMKDPQPIEYSSFSIWLRRWAFLRGARTLIATRSQGRRVGIFVQLADLAGDTLCVGETFHSSQNF